MGRPCDAVVRESTLLAVGSILAMFPLAARMGLSDAVAELGDLSDLEAAAVLYGMFTRA